MTRLAFFGELARIQIELKAESFEAPFNVLQGENNTSI